MFETRGKVMPDNSVTGKQMVCNRNTALQYWICDVHLWLYVLFT